MRFRNSGGKLFKGLSKTQQLRLVMVLVACGLVFYAAGIATNFFASPVFSMFFVISYQTAHNIVTYLAVAAAVALSIAALSVGIIKNRKVETPEIRVELGSRGWKLFKGLSKTQQLRLVMVLVACGLVFYAAGIATNFFGSTVFSMFFVISYQTAHNTVTYLAVTLAVALGVLALCLVETRETHTDSNSYDEPNEEPNEEPIIVFSPTSTFEMLDNLEKEKT